MGYGEIQEPLSEDQVQGEEPKVPPPLLEKKERLIDTLTDRQFWIGTGGPTPPRPSYRQAGSASARLPRHNERALLPFSVRLSLAVHKSAALLCTALLWKVLKARSYVVPSG